MAATAVLALTSAAREKLEYDLVWKYARGFGGIPFAPPSVLSNVFCRIQIFDLILWHEWLNTHAGEKWARNVVNSMRIFFVCFQDGLLSGLLIFMCVCFVSWWFECKSFYYCVFTVYQSWKPLASKWQKQIWLWMVMELLFHFTSAINWDENKLKVRRKWDRIGLE